MSDLDDIVVNSTIKDVSLKTLKKHSNRVVLKALEYLENILDDVEAKRSEKITTSKFLVTTHFVILDKEEQEKFKQEQMKGLRLRNSKVADDIVSKAENYKSEVVEHEDVPKGQALDMGFNFLEEGEVYN